MKISLLRILPAFLVAGTLHADVVISEIMYHPSSEKVSEEYIELHNNGIAAVDVTGWTFTHGISIVFPSASIPAGERLVVAADSVAFAAKYPAVAPVIGGWTGRLSNSGERITLENSTGGKIDEVDYADDGDWAQRAKDTVADYGHYGLGWTTAADGGGSSLELIQTGFDNSSGQNWAASTTAQGTPGAPNSVAAADIPPVILEVSHFPFVPSSSEPVTVTATVSNDSGSVANTTVHWRIDGQPAFTSVNMVDDGLHGDTLAGDGIYGVTLPVHPAGTVIEFYVSADDAGGKSRTWPAEALDTAGNPGQTANCLYLVDDTPYNGNQPLYQMVLRAVDKAELTQINTNNPSIPGVEQNRSHAQVNVTFISRDGTGSQCRYLCGLRNRGNGSRSAQPQSFRISIPNSNKWEGITALNLNTQNTHTQLLGSAVFRKAGVTIPLARAVQVRTNTTNPTTSTAAPSYGFYVANEVLDSDFTAAHYPEDSSGNLYRGQHHDGSLSADFSDWSTNPDPSIADPAPYKEFYYKKTNSSEDNWTDLIGLTQIFTKGRSPTLDAPTWDADYASAVNAAVNVKQWMGYFAVNTVTDNTETCLANGHGDDFFIYFGVNDLRSQLINYDLDSILGRSSSSSVTDSLWRMCVNERKSGKPPAVINPFMKHPDFAPVYYQQLKRLIDGAFSPAQFDPLADDVLGDLISAPEINNLKTFNAARTAWIATQIPLAITVTNLPAVVSGYPKTTSATVALAGRANAITTRSILVNGVPATWTAWTATWSSPAVPLHPGINRVLIQSFDTNDIETNRFIQEVWYDDSSLASVSSNITTNTLWTAAGGPWKVENSISITSGATLTIEPGASVYLAAGSSFTVASGGAILAEGTETSPIFFGSQPGSGTWNGLIINGGPGSPVTRISHTFFTGNNTKAIDVNAGDVVFDHLDFGTTNQQYISLDGASFVVSHCHFPTATAAFELVHGTQGVKAGGHGIIRQSWFGITNGYNDVVDFTGGKRPAPILQVIDCVFAGSGDDILDIDGTDAWVEGNIFLHCHKNGSPDSSAAVSGGDDAGFSSNITITGNLFFDVDSAATAKIGNYYTFINNTVVHQTITGGLDSEGGVLNLGDQGTATGAGAYSEANILADCEQLLRFYNPAQSVVTFNNNLMDFNWTGPGAGNSSGEPLFQHVPVMAETTFSNWSDSQIMKQWLSLKPGSPAVGTGPNGRDKGGVIANGVCLSANVPTLTNQTSVTITVGPVPSAVPIWNSGFTHYRWQLDGGGWSPEIPTATPLALSALPPGLHTLEVSGKNDALTWQDDPNLGETGVPASFTWTVDPNHVPPAAAPVVQISEVLAKNSESLNVNGIFPDLIEIRNAGNATANLEGWGLTDDASVPYQYTFPPGTMLAPGARLVIHASSDALVPEPKTGFGLKDSGEILTLRKSVADGGSIADSVAFGNQIPDYSIGRRETDGTWDLCRPTFGSPNIVATQGDPNAIRINEWLASAGALSPTDFIELHNPTTLPVNLGNCYLTNNPVEWPDQFQLGQLTFIGNKGYALFKADDATSLGPDHLPFKLASAQGEIGLFDAGLTVIDAIIYGPQSTDVSQGRSPNGSTDIAFFTQPTPGAANPGSSGGGGGTHTLTLLPNTTSWRYNQTGTDLSATFHTPGFDDSAWSGPSPALLYVESSGLPWAKSTPLTIGRTSYYFRTSFDFPGVPAGSANPKLQLTTCADDGFVAYLNGTEILRVGMPTGTVTYSTLANRSVDNGSLESFELPESALSLLQPTGNVLAVEVHQITTGSSDIVWGGELKLDYTPLSVGTSSLVLNEIIANPETGADALEIVNPTSSAIALTDASLSNETANPRKFIFPAGASIPAGSHLILQCDPGLPPSASNTGFALDEIGGILFLYSSISEGGNFVDGVTYGNQIPGYSIGRQPDTSGPWSLNQPTLGTINISAPTGSLLDITVNEWLAKSDTGPDWFELYNNGNQPVLLGGSYLTDKLSDKTKNPITPLTFIGGSGISRWLRFFADSDASIPGHVNFSLSTSGEALGLFNSSAIAINAITFGQQSADISEGRLPDGSASIAFLLPTPAAANAPLDTDSDSDGMPDVWEIAHGLDPHSAADADLDADHDGISNLLEYIAGTDPQDATSRFESTVTLDAGIPAIHFIGRATHDYSVLYSTSLVTWEKLTDIPVQSTTGEITVSDPDAVGHPGRFYRVITPAQP